MARDTDTFSIHATVHDAKSGTPQTVVLLRASMQPVRVSTALMNGLCSSAKGMSMCCEPARSMPYTGHKKYFSQAGPRS